MTASAGGERPHLLFAAGNGIIYATPIGRRIIMAKNAIKKTKEYRNLRAEAQEAIVAFEDGADIDYTIKRLASVGAKMRELLG